ncbi:MAG: hypothetical protein JSV84_13975, partial [Gemmatimonadota bacterium]
MRRGMKGSVAVTTVCAIAVIATLSFAQTTPTVNGLFYGDGDVNNYYFLAENPGRGTLYYNLSGNILYLAVVLSPSVNDNVFGIKKNDVDDTYLESACWNAECWLPGPGHNANDLIASDHLGITLTCGDSSWTWSQDYIYDPNKNLDPAEADWVSDPYCSGPGCDAAGTPPGGLISSASSIQWNMNNTLWDVTGGGIRPYAEWKSPDSTYGKPGTNEDVHDNNYPYFDSTWRWEWSIVYEMSIDVSGCGGNSILVWPYTAHNSPSKDGIEDVPFDSVFVPRLVVEKTRTIPTEACAGVGDSVTFEIVISNGGQTDLDSVVLMDRYDPDCLTFVEADPLQTSLLAGAIVWNDIGPLLQGASTTVAVRFTAKAACGTSADTAVVTYAEDEFGSILPVVTSTAQVNISPSEFRLTKTRISPETVLPGDPVVFEIDIANTGPTEISLLPLADTYDPVCLDFDSAVPTPDGQAAGSLTWTNLGPLPNGDSKKITLNFSATDGCLCGCSIIDTAAVSGAEDEYGCTLPDKQDTAFVDIDEPGVHVFKEVSSPVGGVASWGEEVTFRIIVENTSASPVSLLPLYDRYDPSCLSFVSAEPPADYTEPGLITWNTIGTLDVGAFDTVYVVYESLPGCCGETGDTVSVEGAESENGTPVPDDFWTTFVFSGIPLSASKTDLLVNDWDGDGTFSAGDDILYTVTIINTGAGPHSGVVFHDTLDVSMTLVDGSVTTTQGIVTAGNISSDDVVAVDVGTILEGETVIITFLAGINDPIAPDITHIFNQGLVTSDFLPSILTDDSAVPDPCNPDPTITGTTLKCPIIEIDICPETTIAKPNSVFQICICASEEGPHALADEYVNSFSFCLQIDTTVIFFDSTITFENTCLDSSGWDLKWKHPDGDRSLVQMWLIGGGEANSGVVCDSCLVTLQFLVNGYAAPGERSPFQFCEVIINEGWPCVETRGGDFIVNRPPYLTWNGEAVNVPFDSIKVHLSESHTYSFTLDAHDPDGDSLRVWVEEVYLPGGCAEPPNWLSPVAWADSVRANGEWDFQWHPTKGDDCDSVTVDFVVMSTFETGQPLYDTLRVDFIVQNCDIAAAWGNWPPKSCVTDIGLIDYPGLHPGFVQVPYDSTDNVIDQDVWACGKFEIPVDIHFDYAPPYVAIYSLYFEVDYDPTLEVFEVGNEGLVTEDIGVLTYNIDDVAGKIYVTMAFNYNLVDEITACFGPGHPTNIDNHWYQMFYVGFKIPDDAVTCTYYELSVDNLVVNEEITLEPGMNSCWVPKQWLHVQDFESAGWVYYSDTYLPVEGVNIFQGDACYEGALADVTDDFGMYGVKPFPGCASFCIWPEMDNTLTVQDQIVTSFDATMILRMLCGAMTLSHNDSLAADVTGDGTIGAFDASVILKWVVTGYVGNDLIPAHFIGDWIFEGDLGCLYAGPYEPECMCFSDLTSGFLLCWEAVITGDVSQNYPGPAKVVAGDLDARVVGNVLTMDLSKTSAVDMVIASGAELKVADVTATGLVEWAADGRTIRLAGASETDLGVVTVTFERVVPTELEITARADEGALMTSVVKVVPLPTEYSLSQNYPNPFN